MGKRIIKTIGLIFIIIFSSITLVWAWQSITDTETMYKFAKVVRVKGFACDECVRADFTGKRHRGKEFRIICDAERNAFRVIITPDNFLVEPW